MRFITVPFDTSRIDEEKSKIIWMVIDTKRSDVVAVSNQQHTAREARDSFEENPDQIDLE